MMMVVFFLLAQGRLRANSAKEKLFYEVKGIVSVKIQLKIYVKCRGVRVLKKFE